MSELEIGSTVGCPAGDPEAVDRREQLFNDRQVGTFHETQLPLAEIRSLHGILFDLDLRLMRTGALTPALEGGPEPFFAAAVAPWIGRHPALAGAEVRDSGRGLHVILRLDPPVELRSDGGRRRWDGIARVVQAALPIDHRQPGIAALTRPVNSVNGKAGRPIRRLREGRPVQEAAVLELFAQMRDAPFRTVCRVLLGSDRVAPCPRCGAEGSSMIAETKAGRCIYGACGRVKLEQLYGLFLAEQPDSGREGGDA